MELETHRDSWPLERPFRIANATYHHSETVTVSLTDDGMIGRGEACGVDYRGDTIDRILSDIARVGPAILAGADRHALQDLLPACGARNALDAALLSLEAQRAGVSVAALLGLPIPRRLKTTWTIGADTPDAMAERAIAFAGAVAIKIKLVGDRDDAARVAAVRAARPDVWLGVDANRGCDRASAAALLAALVAADVQLLEQPFPLGDDGWMTTLRSPVPTAADESVQDIADLAGLVGLYDAVNIKLDKCGGLTHALAMAAEARRLGLRVMVGNMVGTSLSLAPAYLLGQACDIVDLDGPLLLARDREPAARYDGGKVEYHDPVWTGAGA